MMSRASTPYRIKAADVAAGHAPERLKMGRQMSVLFDEEMVAAIRARAQVEGTSFGEQVRVLCEWGLEAEKADWR